MELLSSRHWPSPASPSSLPDSCTNRRRLSTIEITSFMQNLPQSRRVFVANRNRPGAFANLRLGKRSVIRVYDEAGKVIETHEQGGRVQRVVSFHSHHPTLPAET